MALNRTVEQQVEATEAHLTTGHLTYSSAQSCPICDAFCEGVTAGFKAGESAAINKIACG